MALVPAKTDKEQHELYKKDPKKYLEDKAGPVDEKKKK